MEATFLRSLGAGDFTVVDLELVDYERAAELVSTYSDLPLGAVDASVVAIAERLGVDEIATLDRRHFTVCPPPPHLRVHAAAREVVTRPGQPRPRALA